MVIVISDELLAKGHIANTVSPIWFRSLDNGETYNGIGTEDTAGKAAGSIFISCDSKNINVNQFGKPQDKVRIIATPKSVCSDSSVFDPAKYQGPWTLAGYIKKSDHWQESEVMRVPAKYEMFSPERGLFESSLIAEKCVFIIGLGSGGSPIVVELAKLGIAKFILLDHDRLEVGNVVRHQAGLSDLGRLKTNVMKDKILDINPYANVVTCSEKITADNKHLVKDFISKCDIVINAADGYEAKIIVNQLCVELNKPLIMAGAFRRAYGGQILFVEPGKTPCYQCFLNANSAMADDIEISNQQQASSVAYSDRPVAAEPGLSNDIIPICQMAVKLTLTYLLGGKNTTLKSLNDDLTAFWYLWLNRREAGTNYENLAPMGFGFGEISIMRWYCLPMDRDPACPCCGDFVGSMAKKENFEIKKEDKDYFAQC